MLMQQKREQVRGRESVNYTASMSIYVVPIHLKIVNEKRAIFCKDMVTQPNTCFVNVLLVYMYFIEHFNV